uniref:Uncharacterized protein n=1 Tax=Vespula pensylvanica TaxID=30213 RepID=A0A834JK45_VESPE|nr:hypothetical protein H0235_017999 [Vespula pensylvanica]
MEVKMEMDMEVEVGGSGEWWGEASTAVTSASEELASCRLHDEDEEDEEDDEDEKDEEMRRGVGRNVRPLSLS